MEISIDTVFENEQPEEKTQVNNENYNKEENKPKHAQKKMRRQSTVFSIVTVNDENPDVLNKKPEKDFFSPICKLWLLRVAVIFGIICVFAVYLPRVVLTLGLQKFGKASRNLTMPARGFNGNSSAFRSQLILSTLNLSNLSIACPTMYIFVPENNVCEPQCGKWSGCGFLSFYVEKYVQTLLTTGAIVLGFFTIVCWVMVVKTWKIKQLPIFCCAIQSLLISTLLGIIDIPGYGYFYCLGQDIAWSQLRESYQHVIIYSGFLSFAGISLIIWLACVFINICLTVYFPLNETISSTKFQVIQVVVEMICAWFLPLIFIVGSSFAGLNGGLEVLIQQPQSHSFMRSKVSHLILMFISIAMLTAAILILYRLRAQNILSAKFSKKLVKLTDLEKRYLVYACVYLIIGGIRTVLLIGTDFQQKDLEFNLKEYTACITLQSKVISPSFNQTVSSGFNLTTPLPQCNPPCVFAIDAIAIRVGLFLTFFVTSIQSLPNIVKKILFKISCSDKKKQVKAVMGKV